MLIKPVLCLALALAACSAAAQTTPSFEVATIKPIGPNSHMGGFYAYPGNRIQLGYSTLKMMIQYAYDVQEFEITGGPGWISSDRYDVVAIEEASTDQAGSHQPPMRATPTALERQMIQTLLADRFGLRIHHERKDAAVYLLERGTGELQLKPPENPDSDARGHVVGRPGGIYDGEAFGNNISMGFLARQLGQQLNYPVLDRTNLKDTYDYHLDPIDPGNQDISVAVFKAMERLGLKLKTGRGPVDTVVVDAATRPTEN
jgi:uncharacterized protein (TIGR03435 family)